MADINKLKLCIKDFKKLSCFAGSKYLSMSQEFQSSKFNNINGWCYPGTMILLNFVVSNSLMKSEEYLEIGSYCGRSLAAALYNNDKKAHVIEPFGKFLSDGDNIKLLWTQTMDNFHLWSRIYLHEMVCQDFNEELPPIGVMYYDGNHDAGHTYHALKKFEKYLSNNAIIIVDDYNIYGGPQSTRWPGYDPVDKPVKKDVDTWLEENKWANLFWVTPWLHGQAVIIYER